MPQTQPVGECKGFIYRLPVKQKIILNRKLSVHENIREQKIILVEADADE